MGDWDAPRIEMELAWERAQRAAATSGPTAVVGAPASVAKNAPSAGSSEPIAHDSAVANTEAETMAIPAAVAVPVAGASGGEPKSIFAPTAPKDEHNQWRGEQSRHEVKKPVRAATTEHTEVRVLGSTDVNMVGGQEQRVPVQQQRDMVQATGEKLITHYVDLDDSGSDQEDSADIIA